MPALLPAILAGFWRPGYDAGLASMRCRDFGFAAGLASALDVLSLLSIHLVTKSARASRLAPTCDFSAVAQQSIAAWARDFGFSGGFSASCRAGIRASACALAWAPLL